MNFHEQLKLVCSQQEMSKICFWQYRKTFRFPLLTLVDLGVFATFQKNWIKVFKNQNLHIYGYQRNELKRVWKVLYWAFILLRWAAAAATPFSRILASFFRYRCSAAVPQFARPVPRGLVVTTEQYWGLLLKDLPWNGKGLLFYIGQRLLRKPNFAEHNFGKV